MVRHIESNGVEKAILRKLCKLELPPPDWAAAEATKSQQHAPFSSAAFDQLAKPNPVTDVFFGSRWLILALRTIAPLVVTQSSVSWLWTSVFFSTFLDETISPIGLPDTLGGF